MKKDRMNKQIFRGITRNVFLLGLVSLFTDLSSQMVFPLIPLFMVSVLGTGAFAVGIVEGAAQTTASLLKVVSGYWSDKIKKRKPFVLFGYSISTLTKPLFAFATVWYLVLFVRIIERIGKGIRTAPRDALVAESTDKSVRGKAYGFHRALDGIGSIFGALLAFFLLPILGYKNIFLFAFLPGAVAVLIILFIKEKKSYVRGASAKRDVSAKKESASRTVSKTLKVSFSKLPKNLKMFIIISSIFALGHFGYAFILLRAKDIGLTDNRAILLYVLFYVIYTICVIPAGILSDKIGRKPVLVLGYSTFALTSVGLIFASISASITIFFAIYGIFFAMIDGVQRAFVVDLSPKDLKATALGTFHTAVGLVALPGGFIAGVLWDKISPETTFLYGFAMTIFALVLFSFVKKESDGTDGLDESVA